MNARRSSAVRVLFDDVRGQHSGLLAAAASLMAIGALAEGAGVLTIVPLLALVAPGRPFPAWLKAATTHVDPFLLVLGAFVIAMIVRAVVLLLRDRAIAELEAAYDVSLRVRAAATLAERGWPFAARVGQAGMQNLLANDVPRTSLALHQGLAATTTAFILIVQLAVAAYLSPLMAAGALILLLLGIPALVSLSRRSRETGEGINESQGESSRAVFTLYAGLKSALAQDRVGHFLGGYRRVLDQLRTLYVGFAFDLARSRARHGVAAAIAAAGVIAVGHLLHLELTRLIALLILFARMSSPAQGLQQALVGMSAYATSFEAIERLLGRLVDLPGPHDPAPSPMTWTSLECRAVALRREGNAGLTPVSFAIDAGRWLAVIGASGAGKTTLLDIVAGLLEPSAGQIFVDGSPTDLRVARWRQSLAYVGQQESPLESTIREALDNAGDEDCWRVLRLVGLDGLVGASPEGLMTPLADRGARLSGGERQRLMIARALLRNPRLLLLDEATAAIDVGGERACLSAIRGAYPNLAIMLVAHRAESAALCDATLTIVPPQ